MSTQRNKKPNDWLAVLDRLRASLNASTISKLFEDDYFIFQLIKILYEDIVEIDIKIEILSIIEQYGSEALHQNSVDQVITALLDVFRELFYKQNILPLSNELLITVTTLFVEHDHLLGSKLCGTFVEVLCDLISKVNHVNTRRLRACCCYCLSEIETWKPGSLWTLKDKLITMMKEEKTDVCQEYMLLVISIFKSGTFPLFNTRQSLGTQLSLNGGRNSKDLLPVVSHIMDNLFVLTPSGKVTIVSSIVDLVKSCTDMSPTVFKPLMLQCMSSLDPSIISLMLTIQNEFRGELLSEKEEQTFSKRLVSFINHPGISVHARLSMIKWMKSFLQQNEIENVITNIKNEISPVVFEPLDLITSKFSLSLQCSQISRMSDSFEEFFILQRLAETTGGLLVTKALFQVMYLYVLNNESEEAFTSVLGVTQTLFRNYPKLIPVIMDFLHAMKINLPKSTLSRDILHLLHNTVISLSLDSLLENNENYLQVLLMSSKDSSLFHQSALRKLLVLVQFSLIKPKNQWKLGCLILHICRLLILHQHTDIIYTQLGELMYFMMCDFGDTDIQDQARFYYNLLTICSDSKAKEILSSSLVNGIQLSETITDFLLGSAAELAPTEIQTLDVSPIKWKREAVSVEYTTVKNEISDSLEPVTESIDRYKERLQQIEASISFHMVAEMCEDCDFDQVVALSFQIYDAGDLQFSPNIHIPLLSKPERTPVVFKFVPKCPEPTKVRAKVLFGYKKSTYECELGLLEFSLSDFLRPFPWSVFDITDRQVFFNLMWCEYSQVSTGPRQGVESVKIIQKSNIYVKDVWSEAIVTNDPTTESPAEVDFMFFTPPRYHVLFKLQQRATDAVLRFVSDYWPILRHIDHFLDKEFN